LALFGARVEYALHTLLNLSLASDAATPSARDLAEFQRLPTAFVRRLLTDLEKAGLVVSAKGRRGGWRLARDASQITVLAVADAAGPRVPLFACREIRARCVLWPDEDPPAAAASGTCSIHAVMLAAEIAMRRQLSEQTLADIAGRVSNKTSPAMSAQIKGWFDGRSAARGPSIAIGGVGSPKLRALVGAQVGSKSVKDD
jgi:Rrf2 family protein